MNTDPLRPPETDTDPAPKQPGWPAAWAVLAIGIVALVVFAAAWSRS